MDSDLKLLCVLAHPDDESLGTGGILAKYGAEGIATYLITATLGERGRIGGERPGAEVAAPIRSRELERAAERLGVREVVRLGYHDGDLDRADPVEATARIAAHVRRLRPQVVVTFPADGAYGHVDHIAISQLTGAAMVAAADPGLVAPSGVDLPPAPHAVSKLYWMAWTESAWAAYQHAFGRLVFRVDGVERQAVPWPDWSITTTIDTSAHWRQVWSAVQCHESQLAGYQPLADLPEHLHEGLWGQQEFYRVFSRVNGGRAHESDLFEGLRGERALASPPPNRG